MNENRRFSRLTASLLVAAMYLMWVQPVMAGNCHALLETAPRTANQEAVLLESPGLPTGAAAVMTPGQCAGHGPARAETTAASTAGTVGLTHCPVSGSSSGPESGPAKSAACLLACLAAASPALLFSGLHIGPAFDLAEPVTYLTASVHTRIPADRLDRPPVPRV